MLAVVTGERNACAGGWSVTKSPDSGETRHGRSWTHDEDAQLADEIRASQNVHAIAAAHARSQLAISARAALMIPEHEQILRSQAVQWLHDRLNADPSYDWQATLIEKKRTPRGRGSMPTSSVAAEMPPSGAEQNTAIAQSAALPPHEEPAAPVSPHHVLQAWQTITGMVLSEDHRTEFLKRPSARALAGYDETVLREAGQQLWNRTQQLRLDAWVLECQWPGLSELTITATEVTAGHPELAVSVHELLAAVVAETPRYRDRVVLSRRLGLTTTAPETLQTIGDDFGLTRERVRQLQQRGLSQLAHRPREVHRSREHAQTVISELLATPVTAGDRAVLVLELIEAALPRVSYALAVELLTRLAGITKAGRQHVYAEVITLRRARQRHAHEQGQRQRAQERTENTIDRLVREAEWPPGTHSRLEAPVGLYRLREPSAQDSDEDRRWYSPKLDRAVTYESEVELRLIRLLDHSERIVDFCEQPLALTYTLDGQPHTYYPDLIAHTVEGLTVLIEVKGSLAEAALWVNRAKFTAARDVCRVQGWGFLVTDGTRPLSHLLNRTVTPGVGNLLRTRLAQHPLRWADIRQLRKQHEITHSDIALLALQHNWRLDLNPWRLSEGPGVSVVTEPGSE